MSTGVWGWDWTCLLEKTHESEGLPAAWSSDASAEFIAQEPTPGTKHGVFKQNHTYSKVLYSSVGENVDRSWRGADPLFLWCEVSVLHDSASVVTLGNMVTVTDGSGLCVGFQV